MQMTACKVVFYALFFLSCLGSAHATIKSSTTHYQSYTQAGCMGCHQGKMLTDTDKRSKNKKINKKSKLAT